MTCRYGPRPDRPPDTAHAKDDEFTGTSLASWTAITSGTVSYDSNTSRESCLYASTGAAGASGSFILYKTIPTIPFKVILKVAGYGHNMAVSQRTDVGLLLGASTPASGFIHGALDMAEDYKFILGGSYWSDATTFVTNIGDYSSGGTLSGRPWASTGHAMLRPHWVRFDVNSQSDVDGYWSSDGLDWTCWLTSYDPSFTIATVGIDSHCTSGQVTTASFDYIRFTAL